MRLWTPYPTPSVREHTTSNKNMLKKKKSLMKHQAFLRGVIDSKFNCNFYLAAPVYGASCVIGNRAKLVLLSKGPLFTATAKVMTSATATAF